MTQDSLPEHSLDQRPSGAGLDVRPSRVRSAMGAVLGIAVALLLSVLPGTPVSGNQLPSAFAVSADHSVLAAASRLSETRANVQKARGTHNKRTITGGTPALLASAATITRIAPEATPIRVAFASIATPARWPSTTQARAPPRA